MKASTASPSTLTLLSLPIAPLLYLISTAAQRNYLSIWPNTAATLIWRMSPMVGIRQKLATHLHGSADPMESEEQREKAAKDELDGTVAGTLAALTWATAEKLKDSRSMQEVSHAESLDRESLHVLICRRFSHRIRTLQRASSSLHPLQVSNIGMGSVFICADLL